MEKKKLQGFFRTDRTMIIFQILSRDQNLHICNSLEFNQIKKKIPRIEYIQFGHFKTIFYLIFVLSLRRERVTVLFGCKSNLSLWSN